MVYSSSAIMSNFKYGSSTLFILKQFIGVVLGTILFIIFSNFDYNKLRKYMIPLLIFTIVLLVMVLVFGKSVAGAKRWLKIGPLNFQPSELAKITVILYLAWYIDRRKSKIKNFKEGILKPFIVVGVILLLIFLESDLGVPFLIFVTTIIILFIGGARFLHISCTFIAVIPVIIYAIIKEPYRLKRFITFLNPWADPKGSGYQLIQSLMAMGSGGFWGVGLGKSTIKMLFLPEAHTDFIFPIIGEEFGLLGTSIVLLLFLSLFYYGTKIAINAKNLFGSITAFGITLTIVLQSVINMSVSVGLIPTKGLSLPFISFGGSSILIAMASMGILINIGKQLKERNE